MKRLLQKLCVHAPEPAHDIRTTTFTQDLIMEEEIRPLIERGMNQDTPAKRVKFAADTFPNTEKEGKIPRHVLQLAAEGMVVRCEECPICLGELDNIASLCILTSCGHVLHHKCFRNAEFCLRSTCPICRVELDSQVFIPSVPSAHVRQS